ncbi:hypothetical protein HDU91_005583 [Kappamyces sp. JEL0680]|nr:hypothetical protein HDU91_005583 [Kappamyces sp. JEL0680]
MLSTAAMQPPEPSKRTGSSVHHAGEPTIQKYFDDSGLYVFPATVLSVTALEPVGTAAVVLDSTIFHPQGGGQPSDSGWIRFSTGLEFTVDRAEMNKDTGVITHLGTFADHDGPIAQLAGQSATCHLDEPKRALHAQLHSSGHLIDVAVQALRPDWIPSKGNHAPGNCFVEFKGAIDPAEKEAFLSSLQAALDDLIAQQMVVRVENTKDRRLVAFGTHEPCPCGGTHVKNSAQLRGLTIVKIQKAKDCVKIKYSFAP